MAKQCAVVDTCFLEKISLDGYRLDNIGKVLDEFEYQLVAHPYVINQEFELRGYLKNLVTSGYIKAIDYSEFLKTDVQRQLYETTYVWLYNELKSYHEANGGLKQMPPLNFPAGQNIYTAHMVGSSMGDVHMILMAAFMKLPIFLTEDSDIAILRDMAKRRIRVKDYQLQIYNIMDLVRALASKMESNITRKDLQGVVKSIGKKDEWSEVSKIWSASHQ